jgi:hypothetical protein
MNCFSKFCVAVFLFGTIIPAHSQNRNPTPVEQQAIQQVYKPLLLVLNQLAGDDWEVSETTYSDDFSVPDDPKQRIMEGFDQTYTVKAGSHRYQQVVAPLENKMKGFIASQRFDSVQQIRKKLDLVNKLTVSIDLNEQNLDVGANPAANKNFMISGISKCYRVALDNNTPDNSGTVLVALGNWQNAVLDKENPWYVYPFKFDPGAPKIENAVIRLNGAYDYINQKLKQLNWISVANGLSK